MTLDETCMKMIEIICDNDRSETNKKECIYLMLKGYSADVLNLYINIMETSLPTQADYERRISDFTSKYKLTRSRFDGKFN